VRTQFLLVPLTPTLPLSLCAAHLLLFPFLTDVNLLPYSYEPTQNSWTQLLRVTRLWRGVFSIWSRSSELIASRALAEILSPAAFSQFKDFFALREANFLTNLKNFCNLVYVHRRNAINEGIEMKRQTYTAKISIRTETKAKA